MLFFLWSLCMGYGEQNSLKILFYSKGFFKFLDESLHNILKSLLVKYNCDFRNLVLICPNHLTDFNGFLKNTGLVVKAYSIENLIKIIKISDFCIFYREDGDKIDNFILSSARTAAKKYQVPFVVEIY